MTPEEHKQRHIQLHSACDELFADYIKHHPERIFVTQLTIYELLLWSSDQTKNPTE